MQDAVAQAVGGLGACVRPGGMCVQVECASRWRRDGSARGVRLRQSGANSASKAAVRCRVTLRMAVAVLSHRRRCRISASTSVVAGRTVLAGAQAVARQAGVLLRVLSRRWWFFDQLLRERFLDPFVRLQRRRERRPTGRRHPLGAARPVARSLHPRRFPQTFATTALPDKPEPPTGETTPGIPCQNYLGLQQRSNYGKVIVLRALRIS